MSAVDDFVAWNRANAAQLALPGMEKQPKRRAVILTCMDARVRVESMIGTGPGDIHVLRNAGGVVTQDVIYSIVLSQWTLGTEEVMIIQHTKCGLLGMDEDGLADRLEADTGSRPGFEKRGFVDPEDGVRHSLNLLNASPHVLGIPRGFVYDIDTGALTEIS